MTDVPTWDDTDFENIEFSYRLRTRNSDQFQEALDKSFDEWYNTCTFEGAVETSLIAADWQQFEYELASFYEGMEKEYNDIRADQSRQR